MINYWNIELPNQSGLAAKQAVDQKNKSGKITRTFEQELAELLKVKEVVLTTSGSMSMVLALMATGIGKDDMVAVPNKTWIATASSVMMVGAVPILVETDKDTGVIDLNGVGQAIESGVKAIIPVHLNGVSCRTEVIKNMIGSRQITVIEDAAQAFMSRENEVPLGTQGDIGCFSMSVTKLLTTGQGGFCTTNSEELAERLRNIRTQGVETVFDPSNWPILGSNFRFNDVLASIGRQQINQLERRKSRCIHIHEKYRNGISSEFVNHIAVDTSKGNVPIYNEVRLERNYRPKFIRYMVDKGIQVRPLYPAISCSKFLDKKSMLLGPFKESIDAGEEKVYIPSGPDLQDRDQDEVIKAINSFEII